MYAIFPYIWLIFYDRLAGKYTSPMDAMKIAGSLFYFFVLTELNQLIKSWKAAFSSRPLCQCAMREANTAWDEALIHQKIQGGLNLCFGD